MMQDLISRQAAIDAIVGILTHGQALECSRRISALPSAQPEKHTDERTETHACDLISRQAAIDALAGEITVTGRANAEAVRGYANLVCDRIKRLPSAQPEKHTDERTETHACDCISREAAIHLIAGYNGVVDKSVAKRLLIQMPSAQPERQWIPCSERLPEDNDYKPFSHYEDGAVLYCTKNGKIGFGWYYESTKQWANEDDGYPGDVIAWMPLPEPYAERR